MFRISKDKWTSKEYSLHLPGILAYDKLQHFIGGLTFALINPIASMIFWFLWEIKDAMIPWENPKYTTWFPFIKKYNWGGEGFSYKDMVAAWLGAGLIYAILLLF